MDKLIKFNEWLANQVSYKTYLESISHFPEHTQEFLIKEAPHSHVKEVPDDSLDFLNGTIVDFGFENLGFSKAEQKTFNLAFCDKGVKIPDSPYKLRYHGLMMFTLIEPAEGNEPELPVYWKQAIVVLGDKNKLTWIGKKAREDQIGNVDFSDYDDVGDGWKLKP